MTKFALHILACLVGGLLVLLYQQHDVAMGLEQQVGRLKADVRTAVGQKLDSDERQQDELTRMEVSFTTRLWEKEQAIEECKRSKAH